MAIRCEERSISRSGSAKDGTEIRNYYVSGTNDKETAKAYVTIKSPPAIIANEGTLWRQDIQTEAAGANLWHIAVPYSKRKRETGSFSWRMTTAGGNFHIQVSKQEVAKYPDTAVPSNQLIGGHREGVEGCDILIPSTRLSVTYEHANGVFSLAYGFAQSQFVGYVSSEVMFGRPVGEILFVGLDGGDGDNAAASVTYDFGHSPNLQEQIIGEITVAEKLGWNVIDIRWKDEAVDGKPAKAPSVIYVHRVYDRVNLPEILGFGG